MNDTQPERMVDSDPKSGDQLDHALRPKTLAGMIGQDKIRENLEILISAAKHREEALDHVLFYGPPGLGKTTLAHILANEMGVNIKITSGPAVERAGDLAAILTNLNEGDILFIDSSHQVRMSNDVAHLFCRIIPALASGVVIHVHPVGGVSPPVAPIGAAQEVQAEHK